MAKIKKINFNKYLGFVFKLTVILFFISIILSPLEATAETPTTGSYQPLVADFNPGNLTNVGGKGFSGFINKVVIGVVAGAGVLALIMVIWGGIQYISTDSFSDKKDGKKRIQAALGGLLLALSTYLILNTIDPNLTNLDLLKGVGKLEVSSGGGGGLGVIGGETTGGVVEEGSYYAGEVETAKTDGVVDLNEFESIVSPIADTTTCAGVSEARNLGRVTVFDNSGYQGSVSPEIAWLYFAVPKRWGVSPISTYRSPAHNSSVSGASKTSAHMRGEAIDFSTGTTEPTADGNSLRDWGIQDPCHVGIRQTIYQKIGYNSSGGTFNDGRHLDHVHFGR